MKALLACVAAVWASSGYAQTVPEFVTASRPALSIGVEDGAQPYLLSGVADAMRLSNGTIIVGNCSSSDLRFYDSRGSHLRTVGRQGQGPGEFQYMRRLFSAGGDTIGVYDGAPARRLNLFRTDGAFVRTVRLPFTAEPIGRTADGFFILSQPEGYRSPRPTLPPGMHRRSHSLFRMSPDGVVSDSIRGLPGREVVISVNDRIERVPRFHRYAVAAVHPRGIIFGAQDRASYVEISADFKQRVERPTITQPQSVTAALKRDWEAARTVMAARGGVLPVYAEDYAAASPAYRDIIAGNDGRVWIQDPELPAAYPLVWTAYENGRASARVELPVRFYPFEFGADWVLGVSYDEVGIERVQLLSVVRGALRNRKLSPREAAPPNVPRCGSWTAR